MKLVLVFKKGFFFNFLGRKGKREKVIKGNIVYLMLFGFFLKMLIIGDWFFIFLVLNFEIMVLLFFLFILGVY